MYSIKFHFKAGQRAPGLRRVARQAWERGFLGACPSGALWDGQGNTNLSKSWIWDYSPVRAGRPQCLELASSPNSPKHRLSMRPEGMGDGACSPDRPASAAPVHVTSPSPPGPPRLNPNSHLVPNCSSLYSLLRHWRVVLRALLGVLGTNAIPNCCSGSWLPSAQHSVPAGGMTNFLLFSAMGVGATALCRGTSAAAGLWAQTQGILSLSNHTPPSALEIWSEDAQYGKGKRRFPSSVRLRLELCGSGQSQHNRGQSPPLLFSPAQELQPHRPQPRSSSDTGARAAHRQMTHVG